MKTLAIRLLHTLCNALAPGEREVFLGDVEELHLGTRAAIASAAGLIVRRQTQAWKQWHPWAVLFGLILPATLFLTHTVGTMADIDSIFIWMYAANWTPDFLSRSWIVYAFIPEAAGILYFWLVVGCWSWTAGFVIAAVSRVPRWINATLVALVLMAATAGKLHAGGSITATFLARQGRPWSPHWFYDVAFPMLLLTMLVLLPAIAGMRPRGDKFTQRSSKMLCASIAITAFSAIGTPVVLWLLHFVPHHLGLDRLIGLTPLAFAAPIAYWIARRRFRTTGTHDQGTIPTRA